MAANVSKVASRKLFDPTLMMASPDDLEAANQYTAIMEEVKLRVTSLSRLFSTTILPPSLAIEYGFLQIRMVCELVALGCLIAHGDIEETKTRALQKAYEADEILNRLERLHPSFYPMPRSLVFSPGHVHLDDYKGAYLSKPELIRLYVRCGDVLHKGSVKKLVGPNEPEQTLIAELMEGGQKLLNLLSTHTISRVGGLFHFVVILEATQLNGSVQVAIAQSPDTDLS